MKNITVRPEIQADFAAVREMLLLAFPDEDVAALVENLRQTPGYDPNLSLIAEIDARVIGHVMFTLVVIDIGRASVPALTLAPLAVNPTWQNQGIGSLLVNKGLQACRSLGHRIVTVIGHPAYYPRFGFVLASSLNISMTHGKRDEAKMVIGLTPDALDGVRGTVHFPSTFDEI
jgi:putative acetyltransferase